MQRRVVWLFTNISEECTAIIVRVEEQDKQETSKQQTARPATCFLLISCLVYSSVLKMEAVHYFEVSVNSYRTTRHFFRAITLRNLKSSKFK
jgi:hypothetical protein